MLKVRDSTISRSVYLASDRLLQRGMINGRKAQDETQLELRQALQDYQAYTCRKLRLDDISAMIDLHGFATPSIPVNRLLSDLASEYLQWQGQCFVVKSGQLEAWLELLLLVDGSWIIAQAYADLHKGNSFSEQEITHCIEQYQCPFALPEDKPSRTFADNHVHLGGHGYLGPSLLSFCLYGEVLSDSYRWPYRQEYTLFESGLLNKNDLSRWCGFLADDIAVKAFVKSDESCPSLSDYRIDSRFQKKTLVAISQYVPQTPAQFCLVKADCASLPSAKRWLLYVTGLLTDKQHKKNTSNLLQLIRVCNILRNYMMVSGVGLTDFVGSFQFSGRKHRASNQASYAQDGLDADINAQVLREFRASPDMVLCSESLTPDPKLLFGQLKHLFKRSMAENTHFVLHFTRGGNRSGKLQTSKREILCKQVKALQDFSHSVRFSEQELSEDPTLATTITSTMDLRKAMRGYDVAGNENELPIEIFAPALRALRASKSPSQGLLFNRLPKPFITAHAGEDYSHLLSGLRAIDETVVFCGYQTGDRIGHALALGMSVQGWASRQQTAYVTLGEHLDNLAWCYQKALLVIQAVQSMTGVLHLLQEKIHYWSELLYGEAQLPKRLYEAWKLRRNCPIALNVCDADASSGAAFTPIDQYDSLYEDWVVDFRNPAEAHGSAKHIELWRKYLLSDLDEVFLKRRDTIVAIDCLGKTVGETFGIQHGRYFDSVSAAELDLYEAIQDWCMEDYAAKGVILEACPTSNIYIGRLQHYHEHPIFRWNPPEPAWLQTGERYNRFGLRRGAVTVCINTDDAALMPTTIRNEHRILHKEALEHYQVGATAAENWIEKIRKKGVEIFQENHLNWLNH